MWGDPGAVVHTYNPALRRLRQEDNEFNVSPHYIVKPCLKMNKNSLSWNPEGKKNEKSLLQLYKGVFSRNGYLRLMPEFDNLMLSKRESIQY